MNRVINTVVGAVAGFAVVGIILYGVARFSRAVDQDIAERQEAQQLMEKTFLGTVAGCRVDEFVHPKTGERFLVLTGLRCVSVVQIK